MAEIIAFDGTRRRYAAKGPRPQVTDGTGKFYGNQYTRRSIVRMFLCGGSIREVGRRMGGEKAVESEIREALLDKGIAA